MSLAFNMPNLYAVCTVVIVSFDSDGHAYSAIVLQLLDHMHIHNGIIL